ncbi:MAG: aminotransferase [candidate division NC10 bacterium]|jgi:adenosylmethionine-8-amino-7-oxononanoate aminotransferase|nr:aminotransferase [candidate division NC10 bacterium]
MMNWNSSLLVADDRAHLLHPLQHPADHATPHVWVKGRGAVLTDADGREYLDGLACLWNVNVGHGRKELAEAAAAQIGTLAYATNYVGSSNVPAIQLAHRLTELAYPNLVATYFASGGAEANESAFKTARFYWKVKGQPQKVKIISRQYGYHGVTLAAMSATAVPGYAKMFEPLVPNFVHTAAPYGYRLAGVRPGETVGQAAARMLEETILKEGPETVAAVIAEPVQGAGGVIVPPDDYFPLIRQICTKHHVLFIADEVITGFGRTGDWFALKRWGVQPDILSFAKGITSGYLPLGGIMVSQEIVDAMVSAPYADRWMHAYTYSGHPTCCAVALRNLEILEKEGLVENAAKMGARLLAGLQTLTDFKAVGDVRGLGLMAGVELVADRSTKAAFDPATGTIGKVKAALESRGVFTRNMRDIIAFSPPLVITAAQVDQLVESLRGALETVLPDRA